MQTYSIRYFSTTPAEEPLENGFSIPVSKEFSPDQIEKEVFEILEQIFPEYKIPPEDVSYAVYSSYPSWQYEEEEQFVNFQLETIP